MMVSMKMLSIHTVLIMMCILIITGCSQKNEQDEVIQVKKLTVDAEQRLKELGIQLHTPFPPVANYVGAVRSGNLVFLAGHGPQKPDGNFITGKVGRNMSLEDAQAAARLVAINLLSSLKAEIGDLNKVKRVVKVFGMVNSDESFIDQPKVINGCSDLLVSVFGERGKHARSAVGMVSLPFGIPCEIEMIVEIEGN